MSITKEQLAKRFSRPKKTIIIDGDELTIQKPSPLEFSRYQASLFDPKTGKADMARLGVAQMVLVSSMLVDDDGRPLVPNYMDLDQLDATYYEAIKNECVAFVGGDKIDKEARQVLGESEETTG